MEGSTHAAVDLAIVGALFAGQIASRGPPTGPGGFDWAWTPSRERVGLGSCARGCWFDFFDPHELV